MTRLPRILLNAAAAVSLSLLLCLATMAAWVRSYQARDVIWCSRSTPPLDLGIGTCRGVLFVALYAGSGLGLVPTMWRQSPPVGYVEVGGSQGTFFNRFGYRGKQNT